MMMIIVIIMIMMIFNHHHQLSLPQVCMRAEICMKAAADLNCIAKGCQFYDDNHHHQFLFL